MEFQVLLELLHHYDVTIKLANGKQSSLGIRQAPLIKRLEGEIPCTDHHHECIEHQATYNCIVEAQVMLVLFSLLLHVTHHAFYEDYSA